MCVVHSAVFTCLWPHGLQPARILCPWIFQPRIMEWFAISSPMVPPQMQNDFAGVIQLRILKWEIGPHYPMGAIYCQMHDQISHWWNGLRSHTHTNIFRWVTQKSQMPHLVEENGKKEHYKLSSLLRDRTETCEQKLLAEEIGSSFSIRTEWLHLPARHSSPGVRPCVRCAFFSQCHADFKFILRFGDWYSINKLINKRKCF